MSFLQKEKEREMSKLGGTDLTAGGDASVVEKTDCADDAISLSIEAKCREDEAAAAEEVSSVSTLNVQAETERSVETTNEEVANPNAAEDAVIPIDAQESEVKSLTAIAPRRNEETPQSGFANNEEKVREERTDNRLCIIIDCRFFKLLSLIFFKLLFNVNYYLLI